MKYPQLDAYEYKRPSYTLRDRGESGVDFAAHADLRRYSYDPKSGCYTSHAPKKASVTMLFAGDLLCQENMLSRHETENGSYDFSLCFDYVRPLLQSADLAVGNLETPVSETAPYRGEILTHEGPFFCNAPIQYLEALSHAGFDMLTTANNHAIDAGLQGMLETIDNAQAMGFIQTGTFKESCPKYVIVDVRGIKVGFTAFSTSYNTMDKNLTRDGRIHLLNTYSSARAKSVLKAMRKQGAEFTICFPHWGKEYTAEISKTQRSMAEDLTALGYDLVVGAHSHTIQRYEVINGKGVLFSLGNLITHLNTSESAKSEYTILLSLTLNQTDEGLEPTVSAIPCKILKNHNGIPFTVLPVVQSLGLTNDNIPGLVNAVSVAQKRLGTQLSVNTNYPVSPEALRAYQSGLARIPAAVDRLAPVPPSPNLPAHPTAIPPMTTADAFDHYRSLSSGLFTVWQDHAELVQLHSGNTVVRIPAAVDNKPVTIVRNTAGNSTARVVYLGKFTQIVGSGMFRDFTALESVRCFENLHTIESDAFRGCEKLTGLVLPGALREIGPRAFRDCGQLISLKIPSNVSVIGENAFSGCPQLTIYCEENSFAHLYAAEHGIPVKFMPLPAPPAAANSPAEPIAAPAAQVSESKTTEVKVFRQNLTNVGGYRLFIDCYNTAPVSLLGAIEVLEKLSVEPGGKRVAVLGDIVRLGDDEKRLHQETGAKIGKSNLDLALCFGNENAKIMADAIREAGTAALYTSDRDELNMWMRGLITRKDITLIKGPVARLLSRSIDQVWGTSYHVISEHYELITRDDCRFKVIFEKEDHNKKMAALINYDGSDSVLTLPSHCDDVDVFCVGSRCFFKNFLLNAVTIPAPIFNIADSAFRACRKMETVSLPGTLKVIGSKAFRYCTSLTEVTIPEGVIEIGAEAFCHCTKLSKITIPASVGNIGENAFAECKALTIRCVRDSYAHKYALEQQLRFELI